MASPAIQTFAVRDAAADARTQAALAALVGHGARAKTMDLWIVNSATVSLGVDFNALIGALRIWCDTFLNPVFGIACNLRTGTPPAGAHVITLVNTDTSVPNALGYHGVQAGVPYGRVLVQTILGFGEPVSTTLGHEIGELIANPFVNLIGTTSTGVMHAYENCDAVQDTVFNINGIPMTNLQFPAWFEAGQTKGPFDIMRLCSRPFQLLRGGYSNVFVNGAWTQIFGSEEAESKYLSRGIQRTPFEPGVRVVGY
jgi:hypothetical protein